MPRPRANGSCPDKADYFHVCSNETVHGHRLADLAEASESDRGCQQRIHLAAASGQGLRLVYGGAQKNLGPAGVVLVIVRKDMYPKQKKVPSKLWSFKDQAENKSMINTPPTFGVYILLEIFRWLEAQGGLAAMEKRNATKAGLIYGAIDGSNGFYKGTVSNKEQRSHMNVTYRLPSEELTDEFVKTAAKNGMVGLEGLPHRRRHPGEHLQRHAGRRLPGAVAVYERLRVEEIVKTVSGARYARAKDTKCSMSDFRLRIFAVQFL